MRNLVFDQHPSCQYRFSQMTDILIIGAGTIGAAIAYGLAKQGSRVTLLDGDDTDHGAAQTNFGLVWLQGKGAATPAYHRLTLHSAPRGASPPSRKRTCSWRFCVIAAPWKALTLWRWIRSSTSAAEPPPCW